MAAVTRDDVVAEANAWGASGVSMPADLRAEFVHLEETWALLQRDSASNPSDPTWGTWAAGAAKWIARSKKARARGGVGSMSIAPALVGAAGGALAGAFLGWVAARFTRKG